MVRALVLGQPSYAASQPASQPAPPAPTHLQVEATGEEVADHAAPAGAGQNLVQPPVTLVRVAKEVVRGGACRGGGRARGEFAQVPCCSRRASATPATRPTASVPAIHSSAPTHPPTCVQRLGLWHVVAHSKGGCQHNGLNH